MAGLSHSPSASVSESLGKVATVTPPPLPLHRLRAVRRQEGISQRTVARRLDISIADVDVQELETTDLPLSVLRKWREALDVPLVELLVEPDDSLSPPVMKRAQILRLMKTALAILHEARQVPVKRLAQRIVKQLTEIVPELKEVTAWHRIGQRRRRDEYGRAAESSLPDEFFGEEL